MDQDGCLNVEYQAASRAGGCLIQAVICRWLNRRLARYLAHAHHDIGCLREWIDLVVRVYQEEAGAVGP